MRNFYIIPGDSKRGSGYFRGYGGGVSASASSSVGFDSRSPAGEPGNAPERLGYYDALGTGAEQTGGSVGAAIAVGEGMPLFKSVLAGIAVWAITKAIDRFVFGE